MNSNSMMGLIAALAVGVLGVVIMWVWRRRRGERLKDVLAGIGIAARTDVMLPDGNGGQIHLEYLMFTAKGLLVLDVKRTTGVVFASDGMQEWTSINKQRRFTFHNPQPALLDRVAALRLIARDIPVAGYVVFLADADFSAGRPTHVIKPDELRERYAKPERAELERVIDAFSPRWEQVIAACKPSFKLAAQA